MESTLEEESETWKNYHFHFYHFCSAEKEEESVAQKNYPLHFTKTTFLNYQKLHFVAQNKNNLRRGKKRRWIRST